MMLTGPSGRTVGVAASNVQQVDQAVTAWTRAATTVLGTTLNGTLSDTSTTITAFSGVAGVTYHCRALGAGAITHHATNLIVTQGGASITATAAGDTFDVEMITATTCRIKNYQKADGTSIVAATDAMIYKGATDCSANPNYPAASAGDTYRVSVAGKIGGASGVTVDVGDFFICNTDGTASGDQATVGTKWDVFQANLVGALISGGALGTPSSGTLTNCTGLPENGLTLADVTSANASTSAHGFAPKVVAPAAGNLNVVGVANGETVYANKGLLDATSPSTQALGDAAAAGTSLVAARVDHKHAMSSSFSTPATDHTSRGPTTNVYAAGEAITVMDLVILNSSAQWVQTDANTAALYAGMVAISLESQGAGSAMNVALPGSIVRDDTWNWTPGATLYMSETAAAITVTAPTTSGSSVRSVGFALNADLIWFGPSNTYTVNP